MPTPAREETPAEPQRLDQPPGATLSGQERIEYDRNRVLAAWRRAAALRLNDVDAFRTHLQKALGARYAGAYEDDGRLVVLELESSAWLIVVPIGRLTGRQVGQFFEIEAGDVPPHLRWFQHMKMRSPARVSMTFRTRPADLPAAEERGRITVERADA
jgi:hypothetical protein